MIYKYNIKRYGKIILILMFLGLESVRSENMNNIEDVSMIALIANPNKFNGQKIRLIGYLYLNFEVQAFFLSKNDYENSIMKNALWLSFERKKLAEYKKGNNKYVLIEGVFNSKEKGHFGMYSGTIESINRLQVRRNFKK